MFWKLSFRQPSAIDTLLDKEDCTLAEILDEDDVIQECKTQNKKLVEFLARPHILTQLVLMVCKEPEEDVEDKVKFKYPHIACELLTMEVYTIVEELSGNDHLLTQLWEFLDSSVPLNPLVGSFISKVLAMLLNQKSTVIFDYLRAKEDFLTRFLTHLGTSAMMDLLLQMVAAPDNDQCRVDIAVWLKEQGIVERLVDLIKPTTDPSQCVNASQALCDMIRLSREALQMASPSPLLGVLESEEMMQRLLDNMFSTETPSDVAVINGIAVLLTALERRSTMPGNAFSPALSRPFGHTEDANVGGMDNPPGMEQILTVSVPRMKDFHELLRRKPNMQPMVTTFGVLDPPLGNTRLQVVKLFAALLQCNDSRVAREISRLRTFSVLLDLFYQYPWNNFLHSQVELCVQIALTSDIDLREGEGVAEEKTGNEEEEESQLDCPVSLRHHLLHDCQLVHRLLQGADLSDERASQPGGHRQGYMGHLVRMVNTLTRQGEADEALRDILSSSLDEETMEKWTTFLGGSLAEMNKKNETNLGGSRPVTSSMEDSDDEYDPLGQGPDSELERAYQQYQDAKYINSYMDDYGMDDDLNAAEEPFGATFTRQMDIFCAMAADEEQTPSAAAFEAACSERIQQFDDSESDDEESSTWQDKDMSFVSPVDQQSIDSDDDDLGRHPREIQTGSSDDEDDHRRLGGRAGLYLTTPSTSSPDKTAISSSMNPDDDRMDIDNHIPAGVVSWRSDISSEEDLSGVTAIDTGVGVADWTKEPEPALSPKSPGSSWADFSKFPAGVQQGKQEGDDMTPQDMELDNSLELGAVTVTFVDISQEERDRHKQEIQQQNPLTSVDTESPPRHDTSLYNPLTPEGGVREPDSPMAVQNSPGSANDSSSEEENASSDSDDERAGTFALNASTGSEGDALLSASPSGPARPSGPEGGMEGTEEGSGQTHTEQSLQAADTHTGPEGHQPTADPLNSSSSHDTPSVVATSAVATTTATTVGEKGTRELTNHRPEGGEGGGRGEEEGEGGVRRKPNDVRSGELQDGEVGSEELSDNYSFLSKHGLLSEPGVRRKDDQQLVEEKRDEAREALALYEQEVQKSKKCEGVES